MRAIARAAVALILAFPLAAPAADTQPPGPPAGLETPADYILLTVFLRHDQSKTVDEINRQLDARQFWKQFPPPGIEVESWYVTMGIGHVVTLRVPPSRLREVNLSIEKMAWGVFRTEFYAAYDYKAIARQRHEQAMQQQ